MAGDGTLMADLKSRAEELGIADCCHFLGLCDGGQVRELYATASVFTLPSVTASNGDMEGQGLVIQEAQICGLPVVTTWHNGIPDGLIDGTTGYLVHERDVDALADRLVELLSDDALRARMGTAGREFVAGKYDIGVITKNLMEYYHEISKR
jgi:colanic acid/amylovoran biosynthesis glycosyltransferase